MSVLFELGFMDKVAVDLPTLRRAASTVGKKFPVFDVHPPDLGILSTAAAVRGIKPKHMEPYMGMYKDYLKDFNLPTDVLDSLMEGQKHMLSIKPGIYAKDRGKGVGAATLEMLERPELIPKSESGKSILDNTVLLHEAAEMGKHPKGIMQPSGHNSWRPPLQDKNIANTLVGEGAEEASKSIMGMRLPEFKSMEDAGLVPKGYLTGPNRLSRHEIANVQRIFDKHILGESSRQGVSPMNLAPMVPEGAPALPRIESINEYNKHLSTLK